MKDYFFSDGYRTATKDEAITAYIAGEPVRIGYCKGERDCAWWSLESFLSSAPQSKLKVGHPRDACRFAALVDTAKTTCLPPHTRVRFSIPDKTTYTIEDDYGNIRTIRLDNPPETTIWACVCQDTEFRGKTLEEAETRMVQGIEAISEMRGTVMIAKHLGRRVYSYDRAGRKFVRDGNAKNGPFKE